MALFPPVIQLPPLGEIIHPTVKQIKEAPLVNPSLFAFFLFSFFSQLSNSDSIHSF